MEYTKREWKISYTLNDIYIYDEYGNKVCSMLRDDISETNVKLIAAAPELLNSLKRFMKFVDNQKLEYESSMIGEAKEAIKKAIQ